VLIGWLAKYIALRPKLKIAFDVQGGLVSELVSRGHLKSTVLKKATELLEKFIIDRAEIYFCSSKASIDLFAEEFGVDSSLLKYVPDAADISIDLDNRDIGIRSGPPTAMYTGGLSAPKGLETLKDIILEVNRRKLEIEFQIIGYPTDDLKEFVQTHEIDNCVLHGRVPFDKLHTYLARATLCVEPKNTDTNEASGKLLNYMAAARPVVCFDSSNNRMMLGDNGYYACEPTAEAFVDQIAEIIANRESAEERGRFGKERATEKFSWNSSATTIVSHYEATTGRI